MANISKEIASYIESVASSSQDIASIWLIGSRANGNESPNSDWDFVVFGSNAGLEAIRKNVDERADVDLLIVTDGDSFQDPWKTKTGKLSSWEWQETCDGGAVYRSTKWPDDAEMWEERICQATRVWNRG